MNKKALSGIVATMLIILLSLVAVSTLFIIVNKISQKVQMSPEINCFEITSNPQIKIQSTCYNQEKQEIEIKLKRNIQNTKINKLTFITLNSEWCCGGKECPYCNILESTQTKTYILKNEKTKPSEIRLLIDECLTETKNIDEC